MSNEPHKEQGNSRPRRFGFLKRLWRKIRVPIARSQITKIVLVELITAYMRFVYLTNKRLDDAETTFQTAFKDAPYILTFWHGQHIMGPFLNRHGMQLVAMFSKSADAELNAKVTERLGVITVRGSGGRSGKTRVGKGGARALLALRNALKEDKCVGMIADIAHGTAREAGEGIILLAKISGRPIMPAAYCFSRQYILQKSWDKTAIPLPFGRSVACLGEPVSVPADADEEVLEQKRQELTASLNAAMARATALLEKTA